ncbi:hypothetical protein Dip510_000128 [Elusimicrobium posterum]
MPRQTAGHFYLPPNLWPILNFFLFTTPAVSLRSRTQCAEKKENPNLAQIFGAPKKMRKWCAFFINSSPCQGEERTKRAGEGPRVARTRSTARCRFFKKIGIYIGKFVIILLSQSRLRRMVVAGTCLEDQRGIRRNFAPQGFFYSVKIRKKTN